MLYQVTALYGDEEIGIGYGETYEYAAQEAAESVGPDYPAADVILACTHGVLSTETPLDLWLACAD